MTVVARGARTRLAVLNCCLAATPAAWLLLFGLFIVRARFALGRWPAPYQPDPKDLGFDLHYAAIVVGAPVMYAAVVCVIALALLVRDQSRRRWLVPTAAVAGLVVVGLLARLDPGHMFMWLGD